MPVPTSRFIPEHCGRSTGFSRQCSIPIAEREFGHWFHTDGRQTEFPLTLFCSEGYLKSVCASKIRSLASRGFEHGLSLKLAGRGGKDLITGITYALNAVGPERAPGMLTRALERGLGLQTPLNRVRKPEGRRAVRCRERNEEH